MQPNLNSTRVKSRLLSLAANGSCKYRLSKPMQIPFWSNIDLLSNFSISLKIDSVDTICFDAMFSMKLDVLLIF
jgi:hypothetical protein